MPRRYELFKRLANALGALPFPEGDEYCSFPDAKNELHLSVEVAESPEGDSVWTCQAVVKDLTAAGPNPMTLLNLNDDGLRWCYHAIHPYETGTRRGLSVNLVYTFATPEQDAGFAERMLLTVLKSMKDCALTVTRTI